MNRNKINHEEWNYLKKIFYYMNNKKYGDNPKYWIALLNALIEENKK